MIMTNSREGVIVDDLRQLGDEYKVLDSDNLIARDWVELFTSHMTG